MAVFDPDKHCGAQRPNQPPGTLCTRPKGWGTEHLGVGHCKRHGGSTRSHTQAAHREIAEQTVVLYGLPREVDPHTALLEELWHTAGHVEWLRGQVRALEDAADLHGPVGGGEHSEPREEPHVWQRMYLEERKHLRAIAFDCIRAGIEERRVQLAERQAELIAEFGRALLSEFGIDPSSEKARSAFRKHLTVVAGGQTG